MPTTYSAFPAFNKILDSRRGFDKRLGGIFDFAGQGLSSARGPVTSTPGFLAARGSIFDLLKQLARADASAASGRGLSGSELEIAQAGRRGSLAAEGIRGAVQNAENLQLSQQGLFLRTLLSALGLQESREARKASQKLQKEANLYGLLGGAGGALGTVLAGKI